MNGSLNWTSEDLLLAVDGGGTKTAALLGGIRRTPGQGSICVLGEGYAGPSNPRAVGFETALANIAAATRNAFVEAGLPPMRVNSSCFCIAGAGRTEEQQHLRNWAETQRVSRNPIIAHDAEAVLAAAHVDLQPTSLREFAVPGSSGQKGEGIALIAGTGSLAWGTNDSAQVARSGGWGYLLGDEGSAYSIAAQGLNCACRAADSRQRGSKHLLDAILEATDCNEAAELVEWVYAADAPRQRIASLARVVFDCYPSDRESREIVQSAAQELADMVVSVGTTLGITPGGYLLAAAGGVVQYQPSFMGMIVDMLDRRQFAPKENRVVMKPALGGLRLAFSASL